MLGKRGVRVGGGKRRVGLWVDEQCLVMGEGGGGGIRCKAGQHHPGFENLPPFPFVHSLSLSLSTQRGVCSRTHTHTHTHTYTSKLKNK